MGDSLDLDAWWDEPAYHTACGSFSTKGTFILRKLSSPSRRATCFSCSSSAGVRA
jgi:hypothetical protein